MKSSNIVVTDRFDNTTLEFEGKNGPEVRVRLKVIRPFRRPDSSRVETQEVEVDLDDQMINDLLKALQFYKK